MSRTRRSAINFAVSGITTVCVTLVGFISTPYLIRWLGADRLGAFRLATDWAGYLSLLELGLAGALAPLIAKAATEGREQLVRTLAAGIRAYFRVMIWTLLGGVALVLSLPYLTHIPEGLESELRLGFALSLVVSLAIPLGVYRPLTDALQKNYLVSMLLGVQAIITALGCLAAALAGWGLVGQFGVTALAQLIVPVSLVILFRRTAPLFLLFQTQSNLIEETVKIRQLNRTTIIFHLIGRICLFSDGIVAGLFLGPKAALSLFLTTRLPLMAAGQVQTLGSATWASLAELYHSGQHDLFKQRFLELLKFTMILTGIFLAPLAALTGPFMRLWLGSNDQYAGDFAAVLVVFNASALSAFSLVGWVFSGTGLVIKLQSYMIGQGIVNLGASLLATWWFGLPGPLIGTAFVNLAYNPVLFVLFRRVYGVSSLACLTSVARPLLLAIAVPACQFSLHEIWQVDSWLSLGIEYVLASASYVIVACAWFISKDERKLAMRIFAKKNTAKA